MNYSFENDKIKDFYLYYLFEYLNLNLDYNLKYYHLFD